MSSNKGIKDLLGVGTSLFISQIILGLFWFYLASILSKSEYGELSFLMSIVNVAAVVSVLGLSSTIVVYGAKKENIFPASFIIVLITGSITAVVTFFLYQNYAVSILTIGQAVFAFMISGINSQKRYGNLSWHRILRTVFAVIFAIILYEYFGITGIIFGYFIASLFIIKEIITFLDGRKIDFSALRTKISFTAYAFMARLSTVFFYWGDKAIIGMTFGFTMLASYQLAGQYLLLLEGIPRSIMVYLVPQESEGHKNKKIKIFSIVISILIAIVSILAVPIIVNEILPEYEDAIRPIQILSISVIPLTISAIQLSEFLGKENSKVVLIGGILQSGLYIIFIPILGTPFGLEGIAIGLLVATIVRVLYNLSIKKTLKF